MAEGRGQTRFATYHKSPTQDMSVSAQWIFPVEALHHTPSVDTSNYTIEREMYDRSRGVEFLFRLGSSLGLSDFTPFQSLNQPLTLSLQTVVGNVHRRNLVPSFLHAVFYGGLPPTGVVPVSSRPLPGVYNLCLGYRRCLYLPSNENGRVWQKTSRRCAGVPIQSHGHGRDTHSE